MDTRSFSFYSVIIVVVVVVVIIIIIIIIVIIIVIIIIIIIIIFFNSFYSISALDKGMICQGLIVKINRWRGHLFPSDQAAVATAFKRK